MFILLNTLETSTGYREQLDLLMKHELPVVNCEDAPWALHKVVCALDSWLHILSSASKSCSLTLNSVEQVPEPMEIDVDGRSISGKEDLESIREDGELPSLVTAAASLTSSNHTPSIVSNQARSRQLALMTKNLDSPVSKGKSPSFKKYEDDLDLVLDDDSEVDEPVGRTEAHVEALCPEKADNSWVDYGAREFALVFSRKTDGGKLWKLEATVTSKNSIFYNSIFPIFFSFLSVKSSCIGRCVLAWSILFDLLYFLCLSMFLLHQEMTMGQMKVTITMNSEQWKQK